MPELPEVETIVRGLSSKIVGLEIEELEVRMPKMIWLDDTRATGETEVAEAQKLIEGQSITVIRRRGKMMIAELSNGYVMLIHLKMTGQLVYVDTHQHRLAGGHPTAEMAGEMPVKATHVIFHFSDGSTLYFNDQRQFGYLKILSSAALQEHLAYTSFGPEPLEPELTLDYLMTKAKRRPNLTIKQFILEQSIIAGIGNIYADESLFESNIYPGRLVKTIDQTEMSNLLANIKLVLQKGLDYGGTSSQHYVQADGKQGTMQDHLMVYRRADQSCLVCGSLIERTVIGGRGTHYCPQCQPIQPPKSQNSST